MITVFEHLEDHDNNELPAYEWEEQLKEAVISYNEEYGTSHDPQKTFNEYCRKTSNQVQDT